MWYKDYLNVCITIKKKNTHILKKLTKSLYKQITTYGISKNKDIFKLCKNYCTGNILSTYNFLEWGDRTVGPLENFLIP